MALFVAADAGPAWTGRETLATVCEHALLTRQEASFMLLWTAGHRLYGCAARIKVSTGRARELKASCELKIALAFPNLWERDVEWYRTLLGLIRNGPDEQHGPTLPGQGQRQDHYDANQEKVRLRARVVTPELLADANRLRRCGS